MDDFARNLDRGQVGESLIASWIISRGKQVLPIYEKELHTGKGPRFFTDHGQVVAPDMFVFPSMCWVEAKHKTVFTWHRISRQWVTGIDLRHYAEYQRCEEISGRPVWLMFLHRVATPDARDVAHGCPATCPVGLFTNRLSMLMKTESHRHANWGRFGMVYWPVSALRLVASLEDVEGDAA
jgi:hypothetical protein